MKTTDKFTITLGGESYEIGYFGLGVLSAIVPALDRIVAQMQAARRLDESGMKDATTVICEVVASVTGQTVADVQKTIKATIPEILAAMLVIRKCTLGVQEEQPAGEPAGEALAQTK